MRVNILLACTECKRRNYATVKNKKNTTGRVETEEVLPLVQDSHGSPRNPVVTS